MTSAATQSDGLKVLEEELIELAKAQHESYP